MLSMLNVTDMLWYGC